jgi:MoxR-like ATPase
MATMVATGNSVQARMLQILAELKGMNFERDAELTGAVVALLARQHMLLLGDPGTGKSRLIRGIAQRIEGARYFQKQLARDTKTEEVFGMWDMKAMESGLFKRAAGARRMQDAHVVFMDEIGKAGSNIRNQLLLGMEEREFEDGDQVVQIPLMTMFAASNEMFTDDDETAAAVWDRFVLRYVVRPIQHPANFRKVLDLNDEDGTPGVTVTLAELQQAQAEVKTVDLAKVNPLLERLWAKVNAKKIPVSIRRWKRVQRVVRAHAWLHGRMVANEEDLEVAAHALWVEPNQLATIRKEIMELANPLDQEALELHDQALEVYTKAMDPEVPEDKLTDVGREANKKLRHAKERLQTLKEQAEAAGKSTERIMAAWNDIDAWNKEVATKCLGL